MRVSGGQWGASPVAHFFAKTRTKPAKANSREAEQDYEWSNPDLIPIPAFGSLAPERRLKAAVLMQAWLDLWGKSDIPMTQYDRTCLLAWVVGRWLSGRPYITAGGFSFEDCCMEFNLDVQMTRDAILNRSPAFANLKNVAFQTGPRVIEQVGE